MRLTLVIGLVLFVATAHASPTLYVSCEDEGAIGVIDVTKPTLRATWNAGKRPRGIRLSPDGTKLYVALSGSPKGGPGVDESKLPPADRSLDGIGEVDLAAGKLLRTLSSGQDPESFDISRDGKTLIVSNEETAQASFVDVASGKVRAHVEVGGEPEGVGLRPDGKQVWVTSEADGQVFAVDTRTHKVVAKVALPPRPRVVIFTPDGKLAYVSSENGAAVTVVDAHTAQVAGTIAIPNDGVTGPLGARPMGLALSADAKTLYVGNGRGGTISIVDTATRKVTRTIAKVGARPWGLALSADGKTLYSANGPSNDVSVIDVDAGKVVTKIAACHGPWGLVLSR